MKETLGKIRSGGIALLAVWALVLAQPVAADDCSLDVEADPVEAQEGGKAVFRIKVQCAASVMRLGSLRYKFSTQEQSAQDPEDYKWRAGEHVFSERSKATKRISVHTHADDECEDDEIFKLNFRLSQGRRGLWEDRPGGAYGLPGTFSLTGKIQDQTICKG